MSLKRVSFTLVARGLILAIALLGQVSLAVAGPRWTEAQAREWYGRQGFLVGANFVPATAINELEMWQAETFDPKRIDLELGWAAAIGMNTMRVFLHDLAYQQDPQGFLRRVDQFLDIAAKHRIRPMLVLFDSVWDPFPATGPQRPPRPGVHNSGWVQSPGKVALEDPAHWPRLETYVTFPWRLAAVFVWIPVPIRDAIYRVVAAVRHRIAGRSNACEIPPPEIRARMI